MTIEMLEAPPALVYRTDGCGHVIEPGALMPASEPVEYIPPSVTRTRWIPITEFHPAPRGVPLLLRVVLSRVPIVVPAMADARGRYRHINRDPADRGAYLEACYRVTHWQRYPDPYLPATRYRVMRRTYWYGSGMTGIVSCEPIGDGCDLSWSLAQDKLADCRAFESGRLSNVSMHLPITRASEYFIEPDDQGRADGC